MSENMNRRDFLRLSALAALKVACFSTGIPRSVLAASPGVGESAALAAGTALAPEINELAYLSAGEQIRRFKEGSLSPVAVLEAQMERIKKYNGPLNTTGDEPRDFMNFNGMVNAITYEHFGDAMKAAQQAEKRYRAGTARALEGITVAIKDENDVRGWRVTMGTLLRKDAPPCEDNTAIIDMLLDAGAVLHIQTTVPEFYIHGQTWSRLWGVTRNPWNLHYAVGGSSGGSGGALAAGFTTLATGSDMGGSIRIPASLCGLYGFKAPFGRVPTSDISYETLGPMARTFGDMTLMQNVISGPHPKVHASLRPKLDYPQTYDSLKGVKIAFDCFDDWTKEGVDVSVRKSLTDAAEVLRSRGAIVDEVRLGWRYEDIFTTFFAGLLSTAMGEMLLGLDEYRDQLTTYAAKFAEGMSSMGPKQAALADALAAEMHMQVQETVFGKGYGAFLMPTLTTPYFPADNDPTKDSVMVNGKPVAGSRHMLTIVWNLLSRYPVVDVPVGVADNNVPMGMQVIGNTFDDLAAFRVASAYSQAGLRLYRDGMFPDFRDRA